MPVGQNTAHHHNARPILNYDSITMTDSGIRVSGIVRALSVSGLLKRVTGATTQAHAGHTNLRCEVAGSRVSATVTLKLYTGAPRRQVLGAIRRRASASVKNWGAGQSWVDFIFHILRRSCYIVLDFIGGRAQWL